MVVKTIIWFIIWKMPACILEVGIGILINIINIFTSTTKYISRQNSKIFLYRYLNFLVVVLCVRGPLVREFMLTAHSLEMTNGDYIFLDVEIFQVRIHQVFNFLWYDHQVKYSNVNDTYHPLNCIFLKAILTALPTV